MSLLDTDIVSVREMEYLRNVSLIIDQSSPRTIQNYMIWRFMMKQIDLMPRRLRMIKEEFDRIFQGTNTQRSRAITCGIYVNDNMGFAVSKLYLGTYFDRDALTQVK